MNFRLTCLIVFIIGLCFFDCQSDPEASGSAVENPKTATNEKPRPSTIVPKDSIKVDHYEQFESIDLTDFNKKLEKQGKALSPEEIMKLYYPNQVEGEEGNQTIVIDAKALSDAHTEVTLIHNNLLDDSMKALKLVMRLQQKGERWMVVSLQKNWQCREGRGHTDWGVELCN